MYAADATERLAEIAHDLWRDRMRQRGWVYGATFDSAQRHHDALLPFTEIDKHDRRQAILGMQALDLQQTLRDAIWYERGPERMFTAEEMHEGLRVKPRPSDKLSGARQQHPVGSVVSWRVDDDGWLVTFTVRWDDSSRSEHDPVARELMRAEPRG